MIDTGFTGGFGADAKISGNWIQCLTGWNLFQNRQQVRYWGIKNDVLC
jgi:hypothetical protein